MIMTSYVRQNIVRLLLDKVFLLLTVEVYKKDISLILCLDDTRDVQSFLDSEDRFLHKVSVLRLEESVGLMMARQAGVDRSTADYFAIMDSHMEVTDGR